MSPHIPHIFMLAVSSSRTRTAQKLLAKRCFLGILSVSRSVQYRYFGARQNLRQISAELARTHQREGSGPGAAL